MGKNGGQGSNATLWDNYGDAAGIVGFGTYDQLVAVLIDGKQVWPEAGVWKAGTTNAGELKQHIGKTWQALFTTTLEPPAATWQEYVLNRGTDIFTDITINGRGVMRLYWGTDAQTQDPKLAAAGNDLGEDHPDYKGICYVVFKRFLMGRGVDNLPNVQLVLRRKAAQTLITGAAANLVDGQVNPACAFVEMATDPINGAGLPVSMLDATSFQAAADQMAVNPERYYLSPFLNSQTSLRSFASDLEACTDFSAVWNPTTRKIEAVLWIHGVEPVSYTSLTIDQIHESQKPKFTSSGWVSARTSCVINFRDRERAFKDSSDRVTDQRAMRILGQDVTENITRDFIVRRPQALIIAAETLRVVGRPQLDGSHAVRRSHGMAIRPGQWVRYDIDPEPGGLQLQQYFRVISKTTPKKGSIKLVLDADETLTPKPYTPPTTAATVLPDDTVPPIDTFRFFQAPFSLSNISGEILCCIAKRPSKLVIGFNVYFDDQYPPVNYPFLRTLTSFGVYGTLHADYSDTATTAIQVDFDDQPDIDFLTRSISTAEVNNDEMLLLCFDKDASQIKQDANGYPVIEIMAVRAISPVSGTRYDLTVQRGRRGTEPKDLHVAGGFHEGVECWLIPRSAIQFLQHASFKTLARNAIANGDALAGFFLLDPYTSAQVRPLADCVAYGFGFAWPLAKHGAPTLEWTNPNWNSEPVPGTKLLNTSTTVHFAGIWSDPDIDIANISLVLIPQGSDEVTIFSRDVGGISPVTFDDVWTFNTNGQFSIVARATDVSGLKNEYALTVVYDSGGVFDGTGGKVKVPYAVGTSGNPFVGGLVNSVSLGFAKLVCDTAGATIEYVIGYKSETTPSTAWQTYTAGTTLAALMSSAGRSNFGQTRFFVRAKKTGLTNSDLGFVDIVGVR